MGGSFGRLGSFVSTQWRTCGLRMTRVRGASPQKPAVGEGALQDLDDAGGEVFDAVFEGAYREAFVVQEGEEAVGLLRDDDNGLGLAQGVSEIAGEDADAAAEAGGGRKGRADGSWGTPG